MYSPTTPPFGHPSSREEGNEVTSAKYITKLSFPILMDAYHRKRVSRHCIREVIALHFKVSSD